jgi:hypothetical protein
LQRAGFTLRTHTRGGSMNYIAEWLDSYRRFWEQRLEQLEEYLRKLQEKEAQVEAKKKQEKKH